MKVKLDEETTLAIEAVKAEKETMFDTLKRMELEMQTLRETTDERVQTAENVAKEKLALELKALEEETERVTKERANLEASFDAKRAELERSFEEKEHLVTSTCEMKVAASKAAAASEFKAAAALQLKVKDLTRKLEEMKDSNNKSDNAMVATATTTTHTTTTASTPTPVKATTTTTNTSLLLKSAELEESCNRSIIISSRKIMKTTEKTITHSTRRRNQELSPTPTTMKTRVRLSFSTVENPLR